MSEINITPLLDLAFVLLIIFVITRPLLEQGMDLNLPPGGVPDRQLDTRDIRQVEIDPLGNYKLGGRTLPLAQIETELVNATRSNPKTVVLIRADKKAPTEHLYAIVDRCQKRGIIRFSLRTTVGE